MDDGDQPVLQRQGVVDETAQVQVLREGHRGRVFAPDAVGVGEALELDDEDFGRGGEAGVLHVSRCLETRGAVSLRVDVVEVSVGAVREEMV